MPAYFSLHIQTEWEKVTHDFVDRLFQIIIDNEYKFKSGYYDKSHLSLQEITLNNQNLLNKNKDEHGEGWQFDYEQILFKNMNFSEVRGMLYSMADGVEFVLLIPEDDIIEYVNEDKFHSFEVSYKFNKIQQIEKLALAIWDLNICTLLQTALESEGGAWNLKSIINEAKLSTSPFAIISRTIYEKYQYSEWKAYTTKPIDNKGIFLKSNEIKTLTIIEHD